MDDPDFPPAGSLAVVGSGSAIPSSSISQAARKAIWGWQNKAYWLPDTGDVWFAATGTHTMRIQVREDGVELDQIVLSPVTYASSPPGSTTNDSTIVPQP
ncbi:MAG: hypothetical protein AUI11_09740 [Acidobacteria bacterium 13_2_20CM_2_66_4]|nr:MAG: hypothetical protein AUI11_09740 [Acidobacteria bacterium 13_2_20CM_2_66_4]